MTLMRYNDFESDPHAVVEGCAPARTPAGAVANRLDLAAPGSNCAFSEFDWMVGHSAYGALDAKLANKESFLPGQGCGGISGLWIFYLTGASENGYPYLREPRDHECCHLNSPVSCVNATQKKQLQLHTFASSCWAGQSAQQLLCQRVSRE